MKLESLSTEKLNAEEKVPDEDSAENPAEDVTTKAEDKGDTNKILDVSASDVSVSTSFVTGATGVSKTEPKSAWTNIKNVVKFRAK